MKASAVLSALRWPGWGRRRAAALLAPPSPSGSRPLCIRPRNTPTDQGRWRHYERYEEKKNYTKHIALFCISPSFPSIRASPSRLPSKRCFYHHWNPHTPLQTCPYRQTQNRDRILGLKLNYFWTLICINMDLACVPLTAAWLLVGFGRRPCPKHYSASPWLKETQTESHEIRTASSQHHALSFHLVSGSSWNMSDLLYASCIS